MTGARSALILGVAWIAFWVGLAWSDVGEARPCSGELYSWTLVLAVLILTGLPFLLGLEAGRGE